MKRCHWVSKDQIYIDYHDKEWGVPVYDDRIHFEFLVLESAQAGLSWLTVLKKREGYRTLFADFDPVEVARFSPSKVEKLILDARIIRNRLKINAAVNNAQRFLEIQKEFGSFSNYCWQFVGGKTRHRKKGDKVQATTPESDLFAKDLKKRGFKFLGPTVIYAHMQATGMVNDHSDECFRYRQVKTIKRPS